VALVGLQEHGGVRGEARFPPKELELFTKKNNNYGDAFSKYGPI